MDKLVIASFADERKLVFSDFDNDMVNVEIGDSKVYTHLEICLVGELGDPQGLVDLFRSMAADWRGWKGKKAFEACEGQLKIEATTDRLGHVALYVTSRGLPGIDDWNMTQRICLEAGALDRIASEVEHFFAE